MRTGLLGLLLGVSAGYAAAQNASQSCDMQANVLTHRNNNYRTGANLNEQCLTWDNVKAETFGKLFTLGVEGQVYAQPLIVWAALPQHDDAWIDIVRGELRAFKIRPDGMKIEAAWTSYCADENDRFNFAKYVPPTVANGKVYLATFSGFVSVYGLRNAPPGSPPSDPNCKVHVSDAHRHKMK